MLSPTQSTNRTAAKLTLTTQDSTSETARGSEFQVVQVTEQPKSPVKEKAPEQKEEDPLTAPEWDRTAEESEGSEAPQVVSKRVHFKNEQSALKKEEKSALSKTQSLKELLTSAPVGNIKVGGHPYPRARVARIILFVSAVLKLIGFILLLVVCVLMKNGEITFVSEWIDEVALFVQGAHNVTAQDPDYRLAENMKSKVNVILYVCADVGIIVSAVGVTAQLIGVVGVIFLKKLLLSLFLIIDILFLLLVFATMVATAVLTRSAKHYPSAGNVGLLNYLAGGFFVGAKLYTKHLERQSDILVEFGHLQSNYSCCGWFSETDWWDMKLKFDAIKIFGESEITSSKEFDIPPEWIFACYFVNAARDKKKAKKEKYFCYVPNSCCKKSIRTTELKSVDPVTCGDSNVTLPEKMKRKPKAFANHILKIKGLNISAVSRFPHKLNHDGCVGAILKDFGQLLEKIAILTGCLSFVFICIVAVTITVCCR